MSGLTWLNDLMVWLAKWVPWLTLIKAGYEGVLFGPGGAAVRKTPGMCWYWPITHELTTVSTRIRSTEIAAQLHGGEVVSVVVLYCVISPLGVLLGQDDVFSTIDDRTQAHLARAYERGRSNAEICETVRLGLVGELERHGINVLSVDVAQRGSIIPIKMLSDYAQHSKAEL